MMEVLMMTSKKIELNLRTYDDILTTQEMCDEKNRWYTLLNRARTEIS